MELISTDVSLKLDFEPAYLASTVMPEVHMRIRRTIKGDFISKGYSLREERKEVTRPEFVKGIGLFNHRYVLRSGFVKGIEINVEHDSSAPSKIKVSVENSSKLSFMLGLLLGGLLMLPYSYLIIYNWSTLFSTPVLNAILVIALVITIIISIILIRSLILGALLGLGAFLTYGLFGGYILGRCVGIVYTNARNGRELFTAQASILKEISAIVDSTRTEIQTKLNDAIAYSQCKRCNRTGRYIYEHSRYYCDYCKQYIPLPQIEGSICPKCSSPGRYILKYSRFYCDSCRSYIPRPAKGSG